MAADYSRALGPVGERVISSRAMPPAPLPNLFGLDLTALQTLVAEAAQPDYRARQIYAWLYAKRVRDVAGMSDLGKRLRAQLEASHALRWPNVAQRQRARDGTVKYLFQLDDGANVEAVYIPEERRRTICISTQAGCPLACAFCLTGIAGYKRNLRPWEILGQVATVIDEAPPASTPWNIVVMGMGEPLLNYDNTLAALRILMDPDGFAVPPRRLTLSTVGILPALERLAGERLRPNLAISLHAPNPALRRALMPIEARYALADVVAAALRYPVPSGGRVTFEYVLLGGVNAGREQALELARLLRGQACKVNLIPLNPAPEIPFDAPSEADVDAFCQVLIEAGVTVSVRRSRGQDILAACGQLRLQREGAAGLVAVPAS
jgi:23S rRNA (adenine2503-C2)-methyltransferase